MARIKLDFDNAEGQTLAGLLETPPVGVETLRHALFAHCFTCGKDIAAASRISRALAARGIAVLRFDFTGLGNSDGDFANTNFTSNIRDLIAASTHLEQHYAAPALLIGHSLGGAAVVAAAAQLPSVQAVATIAAPSTPTHVGHLLRDVNDSLLNDGEATVRIGQRSFRIRRQFLDDLARWGDAEHVRRLGRALLILHSPVDEVVPIAEAAKLYGAALHPKSFISLHGADHLLSDPADAEYVAETLVAWAGRYLQLGGHGGEQGLGTAPHVRHGEVVVTERAGALLRGLYSERHQLLADAPLSAGGGDQGPSPDDLLLMALGASTSMALRAYADREGLALDDVEVRLRHTRRPDDIGVAQWDKADRADTARGRIRREIDLTGALRPAERAQLMAVADRCPVQRTLQAAPEIVTVEGGAAASSGDPAGVPDGAESPS